MGLQENKIRFFGHPQSIYKHFASTESKEMTYSDFLRAMTPYNFRKPLAKQDFYKNHKKEVDHVLSVADVDSDGTISFNEFFFFVLVAQIPSKYIEASFKKNGGRMTADKFAKVLEFHSVAYFLDGLGIHLGRLPADFFAFGACADDFAGLENQGCCFGLANAHDGGRESLGLVFDIATIQTDIIQIKLRIQVSS